MHRGWLYISPLLRRPTPTPFSLEPARRWWAPSPDFPPPKRSYAAPKPLLASRAAVPPPKPASEGLAGPQLATGTQFRRRLRIHARRRRRADQPLSAPQLCIAPDCHSTFGGLRPGRVGSSHTIGLTRSKTEKQASGSNRRGALHAGGSLCSSGQTSVRILCLQLGA